MKFKIKIIIPKIAFIILFSFLLFAEETKTEIDIENNLLWQSKNKFQIPNNSESTRVNLTSIEKGPFLVNRFYITYLVKKFHKIRLLIAPLSIQLSTTLRKDILFNNQIFSKNELVSISYKFNSYRLSYIYNIEHTPNLIWQIGLTGKIRDAGISVKGKDNIEKSNNLGFVPLINFGFIYKPSFFKKLVFEFNADALAAPQGRAEDISLKLNYLLSPQNYFYLGYRILEGGADNKKVFTFSLFQYLIAGLKINF